MDIDDILECLGDLHEVAFHVEQGIDHLTIDYHGDEREYFKAVKHLWKAISTLFGNIADCNYTKSALLSHAAALLLKTKFAGITAAISFVKSVWNFRELKRLIVDGADYYK